MKRKTQWVVEKVAYVEATTRKEAKRLFQQGKTAEGKHLKTMFYVYPSGLHGLEKRLEKKIECP